VTGPENLPLLLVAAVALVASSVVPAFAQASSTLDKISQSGTLVVGTRTGSPPFAYVNSQNQWVGFSIDLVEELIKPALEKKLGKPVKVERKESAPPTRIPLLSSNAVDLIAETMTDTRTRRESVDFSLTFFVTGAQFIVKKGSKIRSIKDIDGKRVAAHARRYGGPRHGTQPEHMPSAHRRYAEWTPERLQRQAQGIGPNTEALIIAVLARRPHPEQGFRTCLGVLRLFRGLDAVRVEAVSLRAVEIGALSYASVASILKHRLDRSASPQTADGTPLLHDNIRGSGYYH